VNIFDVSEQHRYVIVRKASSASVVGGDVIDAAAEITLTQSSDDATRCLLGKYR